MRVGVAENDPWVLLDVSDEPEGGVEVGLIEEFAASIDAEIEWFEGSVDELMAGLHTRSVDLVVGGLGSTSPFSKEGTFTHPYLTTFTTIGVAPGTDPDVELNGMEVAVEAGSELEGLVRKLDVVVVPVDDLATAAPPVALENWLLDDLGLQPHSVRITETDHVMAVPHGENAWLTALERFLLANASRARDLLDVEGQP